MLVADARHQRTEAGREAEPMLLGQFGGEAHHSGAVAGFNKLGQAAESVVQGIGPFCIHYIDPDRAAGALMVVVPRR